MPNRMQSLLELRDALRQFADERDWDQFHSPKNLAMAIGAEAGELLDLLRWTTEVQSSNLDPATKESVEAEVADILIFLTRLADRLDIDLLEAASRKMEANAIRYPASAVRGSASKRK